MFFGEHAVLRGKLAIAGATNQRLKITLTPRADKCITIDSSLGNYQTTLDTLKVEKPFHFILQTIVHCKEKLTHGFDLKITSQFSHTVGLGSSAAIVAATLSNLHQWLGLSLDKNDLFIAARNIIQKTQGRGSGADVAASIYGGLVAYRMEPLLIEKLNHLPEVDLIFTGYKTSTPEVISVVNTRVNRKPERYAELFSVMSTCAAKAMQAINEEDWPLLAELMQQHHLYQEALGTSDKMIKELINATKKDKNILAAKISGSGLGDCIVTLGNVSQPDLFNKIPGATIIPITLSKSGLRYESQ
jgi:mevalonate kinase